MNLPERSANFVDAACKALRPKGGTLHFYSFQEEPETEERAEKLLISRVENAGRGVTDIRFRRAIREIAARTYQVVVDAEVR